MTKYSDLVLKGSLSARPSAGVAGRQYYSTEGPIYLDNGSTWDNVTPVSTTTSTAAYASRPAAGVAGNLFLPSNGFTIERDTGSTWAPWGPVYPITPPPALSGWTWINQSTATASETNSGICITSPAQTDISLNILKRTAPATPYTVTAMLSLACEGVNYDGCGLCWRESSSGKLHLFSMRHINDWVWASEKYSSPTAFSANYYSSHSLFSNAIMLQISDTGTNRICRYSSDFQNWVQFHTIGRTDYITANEIGFVAMHDVANLPVAVTLISWAVT